MIFLKIKNLLKHAGRLFIWVYSVQFWLILLLIGQLLFFIFGTLAFNFPVPEVFQRVLVEDLQKRGLKYQAKEQQMSLSGKLTLLDVELFDSVSSSLIAKARRIDGRISFWRYLRGYLPIKALRIENAQVSTLPMAFNSNDTKDNINHIYLDILLNKHEVVVKHFHCSFLGTLFFMQGTSSYDTVFNSALTGKMNKQKSLSPFEGFSNLMMQYRPFLDSLKGATVYGQFFCKQGEPFELSVEALGPSLKIENLGYSKNWIAKTRIDISDEPKFIDPIWLELFDYESTRYQIKGSYLEGELIFKETVFESKSLENVFNYIENFEAYSSSIEWGSCLYDYISLNFKPLDEKNYQGKFIVYQGDNWLEADFVGDIKTRSGTLDLDVYWLPQSICMTPHFDNLIKLYADKVKFLKTPRWQASLLISDGLNFKDASIFLNAGPMDIYGVSIDAIDAKIQVSPGGLVLENAYVSKDHQLSIVSFKNDFNTNTFKALVRGFIYPLDLSSWMPDWWTEVFDDFNFKQYPLYGDLEIKGSWTDINEIFVYGFTKGRNFSYKGFNLEYAFSKIWCINLFVTLSDLFIIDPQEHKGTFDMQLVFRDESDDPYYTVFKGRCNLPADALNVLPGTEELTGVFDFNEPPDTSIEAYLYDTSLPISSKNVIFIKSKTSDPFTAYGYPFDYLDVIAMYTKEQLDVTSLEFGFAHGVGRGQASLHFNNQNISNADELSFDVSLKGAHRFAVQNAIPYLRGVQALIDEHSQKQQETPWNPIGEHGGLLDVNISAAGIYGDWLSFNGSADCHLYDSELGKIRLFGALSLILDPLFLGLGTLSLNDLNAHININHNMLQFSDVLITGPSARINMTGNLDLVADVVDFKVEVDPFGNLNVPVVSQILWITKPVTSALKLNLRGTIEQPAWEFRHTPWPSSNKPKSN